MKKETRTSLHIFIPLGLASVALTASKWCGTYGEGLLHGLAIALLGIGAWRIVSFLRAAFKAKPPYAKLKQQRNGNN